MITNSSVRAYSVGAMVLHWLIAALIILQILGGFLMDHGGLQKDVRFTIIQWHKTFGILVLILSIARLAWRGFHRPPENIMVSKGEARVAGLVHFLFYALMLIAPLSGWLLVSTSKAAVPTLLFLSDALVWPHIPMLAALRAPAYSGASIAHAVIAYLFAFLLALHVAGALKHSFIDRGPSFTRILPVGPLRRMPTSRAGLALAVLLPLLCLVAGLLGGHSRKEASDGRDLAQLDIPARSGWTIDPGQSSLRYAVEFSGKPVGGLIRGWAASIDFDPADLPHAMARLKIDAGSIEIENDFVRPSLYGDDGLMTATHPTIDVTLDHFERGGLGYRATGSATVRGISLPVIVFFTFEQDASGVARVEGVSALDRLAYHLGLLGDGGAEWLSRKIDVNFALVARPTGIVQ